LPVEGSFSSSGLDIFVAGSVSEWTESPLAYARGYGTEGGYTLYETGAVFPMPAQVQRD
jgi:hypothetical protein